MRSRNIKPGFFLNCELAEVDFASRLLFIGLWCYADREGRFEWKPKQIKAAIFPYDDVKIEKMLCNLMSLHFITRHDNVGYIEHFKKHQHPHPHEAKSILPEKPNDINVIACHTNVIACQEDLGFRIDDVRIEDIPLTDSDTPSKMSIFEIRLLHQDAFGTNMPGGCNTLAHEICQKHTPDVIRNAFEAAANQDKKTMAYVNGVLNGNGDKPKKVTRLKTFADAARERDLEETRAFVEEMRHGR